MTLLQLTFWLCFVVYPLVVGIQSSLLIGLVWFCRRELNRGFQSLRLILRSRQWRLYPTHRHPGITVQTFRTGDVDFRTAAMIRNEVPA